jgi:hypothetical protein
MRFQPTYIYNEPVDSDYTCFNMSAIVYKRCSLTDFKSIKQTISDLGVYISKLQTLHCGAGWQQRKQSLYEVLTHPVTFVDETRITRGKEVWFTLKRTTIFDIVQS